MPFISIIVPTFNDDARLQLCIDALENQDTSTKDYEVLIVNNSPKSLEVSLPSSNFHILNEEKPGSYAARNLGIKHSKGEIVAFTDSDCIPECGWINSGRKAILERNADRVAGKINVFPKSYPMTAVECYEEIFAFDQERNVRNGSAVTANLFTRRHLLSEVGLFDERLLSGGDTEWNSRATRAGFSLVYDEYVAVHHPARNSWSELSKKVQRTTGGKFAKDPKYFLSPFRSVMPPFEAAKTIAKSEEPIRTHILAFVIAYRIKLEKLWYLRMLKLGKVSPPRS
jgi:glycosyltransferase involved in cell wall biosynthesis